MPLDVIYVCSLMFFSLNSFCYRTLKWTLVIFSNHVTFLFIMINITGMVAALTNESATSKSVYFAHCTSEMIFITHLLAEEPEKLAGPLLADTYVTLLKGRNAWYGQKLAKGELSLEMGDSIKGKGMIQVKILVTSFIQYISFGFIFFCLSIYFALHVVGSLCC